MKFVHKSFRKNLTGSHDDIGWLYFDGILLQIGKNMRLYFDSILLQMGKNIRDLWQDNTTRSNFWKQVRI